MPDRLAPLKDDDPEIAALIAREAERQEPKSHHRAGYDAQWSSLRMA